MSAPTYRIPAPAGPAPEPTVPVRPRRRDARPSRAVYLRRRLAFGFAVLLAALALVLFGDAVMAEAGGGAPTTGGHVVVEPGQTLWDVAAANAPAGTDLRAYLQDLKELNGLHDGSVGAWSVVLLPR